MNTNAAPGLAADLDFGATAPALRPVALSLLGAGAAFLIGGTVLIAGTVRAASRN
ncbi:MAG TPA: hypothetical protein VFV67_22650 [Actinophytocola sp.]|uniref:hypothetical protein n=1 Tax=Actinophytocola sp. TaxID=1872138 RepID=UPI002DB593E7|nr:hypothetical protein [Actinophytocola sp.]HEU5473454.1 hypothetical protein [Actinophytocola sp.]